MAVHILGFNPDILNGGSGASFGDWKAYSKEDTAQLTTGLAGQMVGDQAFIMVAKGDK